MLVTHKRPRYSGIVGMLLILAAAALAAAAAEEGAAPVFKGDPYTLDFCPVTGEKLGSMGDPLVKSYDEGEVRFCCAGCPKQYEANPEEYAPKVKEALVKQQAPFYPLDTCLVTGEKLAGDMGQPIDYIYKNRLVRFCCKGCIEKFEKDPGQYIAALDKAVVEKQKEKYPLDACVVSGDKLGGGMGEPIDHVVGNRLVRLCCRGCIKPLNEEPGKYLTKVDEALAGKE